MDYKEKKEKDYRADALKKTQSHWEMGVSYSVFQKARKGVSQDDFLAKKPNDWPRPHIRINECDN